jgi:hypothetical protein
MSDEIGSIKWLMAQFVILSFVTEKSDSVLGRQGDQIGRIFDYWATATFGSFF